ncbi:MAG TPA: DUF115 domain-containing protein [Spirochaetales bacterium]|nr:DUF115 domain-containing protein [Spirochaetales bacterium]HRZ65293.1 DUF115 domain-containing protein [Spirochaetia bacterium]
MEDKLGSSSPSIVILLGPCLGYAVAAARRRLPGALVLSIQYSPFFLGRELFEADASWYPDSPLSLESFLSSAIGEEAASGLAVLDWPPASRAFPEIAAALRSSLLAALDRLISSAATVKASGRTWLANSCRSFLLAQRLGELPEIEGPLVVAAAGPSLEAAAPFLADRRGRFFLIAVSSALAACEAAGLEPDLVLATDGGFWSRHHLYPLARRGGPLALPLSALPSASLWRASSLHLIDQGSFAELELLPFLGGGPRLPPHGTVAGSALSLAASLGSGPIVFTGLDLAARGDAEHARPHGFDQAIVAGAARTRPAEALAWERRSTLEPLALGGGWFGSRSLSIYAQALASDAARLPGRLFRFLPSGQGLPGFAELDAGGLDSLLAAAPPRAPWLPASREIPGRAERELFLASRFRSWRRRAEEACAGLAKGCSPSEPGIAELLRSLDLPFWSAARRALSRSDDPGPAARALAESALLQLGALERNLLS